MLSLSLIGGAAATFLATPRYEAEAQIIALEHEEIIASWLGSRQAATYAVTTIGGSLFTLLYPDEWDATQGAWRGAPRSAEDVAAKLSEHVRHSPADRSTTIRLTVTMSDPQLAREVAQAYLDSLQTLRPSLENLTRSELFDEYYDGTNAQEAQRRAETAAAEKQYWIVFDTPTTPSEPVSPRPFLNMILAAVLGLLGAVSVAFALEWFENYRAEIKAPPR